MTESNTRDIAMAAKTLIDSHMTDCNKFRENLRGDFKEFRDELKKVNWKIAFILGGIVVVSHSIDWALTLLGHK